MRLLAHVFGALGPLLAGSFVVVACSQGEVDAAKGSAPSVAEAGAGTNEVSCADDARVASLASGSSQTGEGGVTITLSSLDPESPARGNNSWSVMVLGATGKPLTSAKLVVSARMPDHGHMSPTTPQANATDAQGRATISGLDLFMAGVWLVDVSVTSADADETTDRVSFAFCVEG